ncbi:4Fe-4S binding protein [Aeromonas simiae]|uniref:4Fe-4S binding protein n=1 Tax=Aeromonas simiae TaxID=218936 RepID=UPI0005AAFFAE|nr:4Fe-4S binding protein [Aeromonas simiae]
MVNFLHQWLRRLLPPTVTPTSCQEPRPPWAVDELQFLSLCTRCGACATACPRVLLRPAQHPKYRDSPILGTPTLDLTFGSCNYCGQCVRTCPTGALDLALGRQVQTRVRVAKQCQASQGFYCLLCEDACPRFAIKVTGGGVQLNQEACNGCGLCGVACLHDAISFSRRP